LTSIESLYDPIDDPAAQPKLVVNTEDLARVVKRFVAAHDQDHIPSTSGNPMTNLCGREYVSMKSGVNDNKVRDIMRCRSNFTSFEVADKILCAIGRQDTFHTDVRVIEA